jgi:protein-S-isoprenylcysteine O-methyltransferase Ste14
MIETIFRFLFFILLVLLMTMRVIFMLRVKHAGERLLPDKEAVNREGGRGVIAIRAIGMFTLIAILAMYLLGASWIEAFAINIPAWLRWVGFGLGILSVALWTLAQVKLDKQWSAQLQLTKDHHLITSGPYTLIRHPLYMSMIGWCVALALLTANWIFVAIGALAIAGLLWRIPREEQMMIEAFGDEYKQYMKRSGRFFPRLWR